MRKQVGQWVKERAYRVVIIIVFAGVSVWSSIQENNQLVRQWASRRANSIARIAIVVAFLLLAIWAITLEHNNLVIGYSSFALWCTAALVNVGPELAGIVIGIVTIDYLNERRQEEQLKKQLILQLCSSHNDVADTAFRALMAYGWLYDGTLTGAYLFRANLENAYLFRVNLEKVRLTEANLANANLMEANLANASLFRTSLKNADLSRTSLKNAVLYETNLENAVLYETNLENTRLENVNLKNAFLKNANLKNARDWTEEQLRNAQSLEGAIMPDGTKLKDTRPIFRDPYDGPTFDEWLAMQQDQVDEQALAEVDALLTAKQDFEEE